MTRYCRLIPNKPVGSRFANNVLSVDLMVEASFGPVPPRAMPAILTSGAYVGCSSAAQPEARLPPE